VAESELQRCLDEVVEFIRALPADCEHCRDLSECREVAARSIREAGPAFVQRWPILSTLLAATSSEQVFEFLIELAVKSKCPMAYLSPCESSQLSKEGFSSQEQLLIGRLLEHITNNDGIP